jgi:hypothetical protein
MTLALDRTAQHRVTKAVEPDHRASRLQRPSPSSPARASRLHALTEGPWDTADLAGLGGRSAIAVVGVMVAWEGASRSTSWNTQQAWTALGVGCLVIGLTGVIGWIRAGTTRLRQMKLQVLETLRPVEAVAVKRTEPAPWNTQADQAALREAGMVVTGDGMSLFHRPSCLFAQGKGLEPQRRTVVERTGAAPCGVCRP